MRAERLQLRVALAIVAVGVVLLWTIPQINNVSPEPTAYLWLYHAKADQLSSDEKVSPELGELAAMTAYKCRMLDFSVYLDRNGMQSAYWPKSAVNDSLLECINRHLRSDLRLTWQDHYGPGEPTPPYSPMPVVM